MTSKFSNQQPCCIELHYLPKRTRRVACVRPSTQMVSSPRLESWTRKKTFLAGIPWL